MTTHSDTTLMEAVCQMDLSAFTRNGNYECK
jgi:hypothetical protein